MYISTVRYFIPEDGDNELQPNIFLAPKSRQPGHPPTLGQIKQAFPLLGRYHYRFKTSIGGNNSNDTHNNTKHQLAVWMDCIDDQMPVPVWQSQIVAKITRIGVEEEEEDDDDDEDFRRPTASQPTSANVAVGVPLSHAPSQPPQQQQPPRPAPPQQHPSAPSFDLFGNGPSVPATTTNNTTTTHQPHNMSANLFDTAPVPASTTSSSLFDMSYQPTTGTHHNASTSSSSNHTSMHHSDFLGMTTAPSPPVSGNYGGYAPQQQQQQQQRSTSNNSSSAFGTSNSSNNSGGAFGDLAWK